ncbi:hypothetical protein OIN59_24710, partial [Acidovorax sp. D2M1]
PHAPDLANHVHGDHLESLLKFSAGQWNTLVNIGLALCRLAGQVCIGTNRATALPATQRSENCEVQYGEKTWEDKWRTSAVECHKQPHERRAPD